MKVLDIDMDFFLDCVTKDNHDEDRYPNDWCNVWEKSEIIDYLENILNLSKNKKIRGRIITYHNESLDFWNDMINKQQLIVPFTVIHVDSHSDLSYTKKSPDFESNLAGYRQVLELQTYRDRYVTIYGTGAKDNHDNWVNEGNYLIFALAFKWIEQLIYYTNLKEPYEENDYDPEFIVDSKEKDGIFFKKWKRDKEYSPKITIISTKYKNDKVFNNYDFITFSISPKYTPKKADFIIDIIKEYIEEI